METTGGDLADDGDANHSTPTTGNTYSRSHTSVKESDDCASDQIKAEAHLDSNGQSIEYENLDNDTS